MIAQFFWSAQSNWHSEGACNGISKGTWYLPVRGIRRLQRFSREPLTVALGNGKRVRIGRVSVNQERGQELSKPVSSSDDSTCLVIDKLGDASPRIYFA